MNEAARERLHTGHSDAGAGVTTSRSARPRVWSGLRARVTALVLMALLPAVALTTYTYIMTRRSEAAEAYAAALQRARTVASDQDQLLQNARQVLATLARIPQIRHAGAECSALLADALRESPAFANLGVANLLGQVVCSAVRLTHPVNIADRMYFQRALVTRAFSVGEYQVGRIMGRPSINAGYPLVDRNARLVGVVFAALDLGWMNRVAANADLPQGATLTAIDEHGLILVRYPTPEPWVGRPIPETPLWQTLRASRGEGTTEAVGLDGKPKLYGFTVLRNAGSGSVVYVAVGIPAEEAFAETNRTFGRNLFGLLAIALLTFAVAWKSSDTFILHPVQVLVAATRRLAAGDASARVPTPRFSGELGQLAEAFNEMAATLEWRAQEVENAEARFRTLVEQSMVGVYMITEDRFAYVNDTLAAIFGYTPDDMLTRFRPADMVHPDDRDLVASNMDRRLRGELPALRYTFRGVRKDGAVIYCEVFGRQFVDAGKPVILGTLIDTTERYLAQDAIERQLQRLQALRTIDTAITGSLDLRVVLGIFLDQATAQLGVDAAAILLVDPHTQQLTFAAGRGFRRDHIRRARLRRGESHAGRVALERRTLSVPDLRMAAEEVGLASLVNAEQFVAYSAAPLVAKAQVHGVLEIFHRSALSFDQEWMGFLETLAGQLAIAVDNARLFEGLERANTDLAVAYDTTLEGWSRAMDLRDKETEGHTQRVTTITDQLARALGMSESELVHVRRGALLHDIGKMGIPDRILLKPGPLTDEEMACMKQHPVFASELLSPIAFLRPALPIPSSHHERWDGSGYPRGLRGEEIELEARIFAVVDVYDALTSDRPYRKAWSREDALAHLQAEAGRLFDRRVVEAFVRMISAPAPPPAA